MFEGIRPQAVLWGMIADLGATAIAMAMLGSLLGVPGGMENLSEEERRQALLNAFQEPRYLLFGGLLGLSATVFGGYVAARMAQVAPLLNAACVGLLSVLVGLFSIGSSPFWFSFFGIVLTPPAAIAGGVLWRRSQTAGPST